MVQTNRWWLLTGWLAICALTSARVTLRALQDLLWEPHSDLPTWSLVALLIISTGQVACIIALLRYRRWGWEGLVICAALGFLCAAGLAMTGEMPPVSPWAFMALATLGAVGGPILTYGALTGGGHKAAWPRLS